MTLPRLEKMWRYWKEEPPTHVILGARYGLIGKKHSQETGTLDDLKRDVEAANRA